MQYIAIDGDNPVQVIQHPQGTPIATKPQPAPQETGVSPGVVQTKQAAPKTVSNPRGEDEEFF